MSQSKHHSRNTKILIVEDDEAIAQMVRFNLERRVVDEAMRQDEARHDIALTACEAIGLKGSTFRCCFPASRQSPCQSPR